MAESSLVDTNVLLRISDLDSADHSIARAALFNLTHRGHTLYIAPQNIMEYWAVATRRREDNGLGMSHANVLAEVREFMNDFKLLWTTPDVLEVWLNLVSSAKVIGKQTHDTHLVAVMLANDIASVLTFNGPHFARFPGIKVLDPRSL